MGEGPCGSSNNCLRVFGPGLNTQKQQRGARSAGCWHGEDSSKWSPKGVRGHDPCRLNCSTGVGARLACPYRALCHARLRAGARTIERDGILADLEAIGATVLANACGPCIGQWERDPFDPGEANTIVTSFNRNFPKRNDGNANTKAFLTSPDMVVMFALAGTLDFDPLSDSINTDSGAAVRLEPPAGEDLPAHGFDTGDSGYVEPNEGRPEIGIAVSPTSDRIQLLDPYPSWNGKDYVGLPVLLKAKGKCTTDQISAAGKWLRYRGHLENISGNLFLGVVNAFTGATGEGKDPVDGQVRSFPEIAKHLAVSGVSWCAVGDENYGEGSSREHAAMEPRYRGGLVILARSFARIHETNLKKQGILPLAFSDPATYEMIGEDDRVSVLGLASLAPDAPVRCRLIKPDASGSDFYCTHTFSDEQLDWFRQGSALNVVRRRQAGARNATTCATR